MCLQISNHSWSHSACKDADSLWPVDAIGHNWSVIEHDYDWVHTGNPIHSTTASAQACQPHQTSSHIYAITSIYDTELRSLINTQFCIFQVAVWHSLQSKCLQWTTHLENPAPPSLPARHGNMSDFRPQSQVILTCGVHVQEMTYAYAPHRKVK